jgi:hypothetical protein
MEECRDRARSFDRLGATDEERKGAALTEIIGQFKRAGCEPSKIAAGAKQALDRMLIQVERARKEAQGLTNGDQAVGKGGKGGFSHG